MVRTRRALRVAGFGAVTATMLPAYLARRALAPETQRYDLQNRWVHAWSGALLRIFGIALDIHGTNPHGRRGRLIVANHRSTIDIGALLHTFGGHMVSRADLAGWPLVGAAARSVGTVFVDRKDAHSGASALRGIRGLLTAGRTVSVFAEGTTFPDDVVRPFHPGAFMAALKTGADILPVGIAYERGSGAAFVNESFGKHLARMSGAPPTRVVMRIGDLIPIADRARPKELRDRTHAAVQALVDEARAISDAKR